MIAIMTHIKKIKFYKLKSVNQNKNFRNYNIRNKINKNNLILWINYKI